MRNFTDGPQRADVFVDGPYERGLSLVEPLQLQQHATGSPVEFRKQRIHFCDLFISRQSVFEFSVPVKFPRLLEELRPLAKLHAGQFVGVLALEGRAVFPVGRRCHQDDPRSGTARVLDDPREVGLEVLENPPALIRIAVVACRADRMVEDCVDVVREVKTVVCGSG